MQPRLDSLTQALGGTANGTAGSDVQSDQMDKFQEFYDSARYTDVFDDRTALLLHLAAAMALGCEP